MTPFAALGVLLLLVLVPGLGVSFAIYRAGELPLATRLALACALGYGVVAGSSYALSLGGVLYALPLFGIVFVATAAAWTVA